MLRTAKPAPCVCPAPLGGSGTSRCPICELQLIRLSCGGCWGCRPWPPHWGAGASGSTSNER
jgi:hypothetical protein